MSDQRHIITVTESTIKTGLKKICPGSPLVVDVIVGYMAQTPGAISDLMLAMAGIERKLEFKPLDDVFIPLSKIHSWKFDEEKTVAAGLVEQGCLKATVLEVNKYRYSRVKIQYKVVTSSDSEATHEEWVSEEDLYLDVEEFPGDRKDPDELPF